MRNRFRNNQKRDPFEIHLLMFESNGSRFDLVCSWGIMADATSLTPPSSGFSVTVFPNEAIVPYSKTNNAISMYGVTF